VEADLDAVGSAEAHGDSSRPFGRLGFELEAARPGLDRAGGLDRRR
jgi:hypothetical protein